MNSLKIKGSKKRQRKLNNITKRKNLKKRKKIKNKRTKRIKKNNHIRNNVSKHKYKNKKSKFNQNVKKILKGGDISSIEQLLAREHEDKKNNHSSKERALSLENMVEHGNLFLGEGDDSLFEIEKQYYMKLLEEYQGDVVNIWKIGGTSGTSSRSPRSRQEKAQLVQVVEDVANEQGPVPLHHRHRFMVSLNKI